MAGTNTEVIDSLELRRRSLDAIELKRFFVRMMIEKRGGQPPPFIFVFLDKLFSVDLRNCVGAGGLVAEYSPFGKSSSMAFLG